MLKKYMIFAFFLGFFVAEGFSETVAFACFQNKDAHESAKNLTGLFEDFLFEPFFDNGFVVTNVPVQEVPENSKFDLVSVKNLFAEPVDYIVVLSFEYGASAVLEKKTGKKAPDWKGLTVSLVRFTEGRFLKKR